VPLGDPKLFSALSLSYFPTETPLRRGAADTPTFLLSKGASSQGGCRFAEFSAYYPGPAVSPPRHLWQSPNSWTTTWRTRASVLSLSLRASVPYWTVPKYVDCFCSVGRASTRDAANKLEYREAPGSQAQASFDDFHFFNVSIPNHYSTSVF
jgi:hypothetical protein